MQYKVLWKTADGKENLIMDIFLSIFLCIIISSIVGALLGLIPLFMGRVLGKRNLGMMGMICTIFGSVLIGVIFGVVFAIIFAVVIVVGFVIALFVIGRDINLGSRYNAGGMYGTDNQVPPAGMPYGSAPGFNAGPTMAMQEPSYGVTCIAGVLKGRVYRIGNTGIMFGREADCTVQFPTNTPGISRRHCALRYSQGSCWLVDMGSSYGTFLGNGSQLAPNQPVRVAPGNRFYLGNTGNMFQITA